MTPPFDYNNATDEEGIKAFLETIWRTDEIGYVHLARSDSNGDNWQEYRKQWPQYRETIVTWCVTQNAMGHNVYYAPALYDIAKVHETDTRNGNTIQSFVKENILGSFVYWVEHDGTAPALEAHTATESDADPESVVSTGTALEALETPLTGSTEQVSVPPPSLIVQSGHEGHEHQYWESTEFITDISQIENVNRRLSHALRADPSGWDGGQLLRIPFTHNHKYEDKPSVTVSYVSNIEYNFTQFGDVPPVPEMLSREIDDSNLPSMQSLLLRYQWSEDEYESFEREVPQGERSDALMRWAYICAEKGLDETEIYAMVENADSRWKKYVKRSDRKKRLLDIVNRALIKHPKALSEITFEGLKGPLEVSDNLELFYLYDDLINEPEEDIPWAITNFMDITSLGVLASSPGVGKTSLSLQLSYSCALGENFLQWNAVTPMRMMIISLEMGKRSLRKFMRTQRGSYSLEQQKMLHENLRIVPYGQAWPLEIADARVALEKLVMEHRPRGIIIDSLGKLTNGKLDEETVRTIYNYLGRLRVNYDCFIWLLHHNRKATPDNKHPTKGDDIYGSTYIIAEADLATVLWKAQPTARDIHFITVKNRLAEEAEPIVLHRGSDLLYSIKNEVPFSNVTKGDEKDGNQGPGRF